MENDILIEYGQNSVLNLNILKFTPPGGTASMDINSLNIVNLLIFFSKKRQMITVPHTDHLITIHIPIDLNYVKCV